MASGSSRCSSSSKRKEYRVPTRELPIVKFDKCNLIYVVKFTAHTNVNGNQNRDFYMCPNHKPKGCNFWKWSDEYEDFLVDTGVLPPVNDNLKMLQCGSEAEEHSHRQGRTEDGNLCMLVVGLIGLGKEIIGGLKMICALLGLVLVVLIMSLCVRQ